MVNRMEVNAPVNMEIVTMDEHIRSSDIFKESRSVITFDYELNDKALKAKLLKAAKRTPLEFEENSTSCNLVFNAGAWYHDVLPSVDYWDEIKGDKTCKIGDYEIKIGGVKAGKDSNGKTVNTQVVFYAGRDKIVCHLYNTTQLILVNGHGYRKFIDLFLKPFFISKTGESLSDIDQFNKDIIAKLGPKTVKRSNIKYKKGSAFPCSSCDFAAKNISTLNKHKRTEHLQSFNSSNKVTGPRESTRNNSIIERLMIEDDTVTNLSIENQKETEENSLKYTCFECNFVTTSKDRIDSHVRAIHASEETEEVRFICINCKHEFGDAENYDSHVKTHDVVNTDEEMKTVNEFRVVENFIFSIILQHQIEELRETGAVTEPAAKYACNQCKHIADEELVLNIHMQTMHQSVKINIQTDIKLNCSECHYTCKRNIEMKKHKEKHHAKKNLNCSECHYTCKLNIEMKKHKEKHHAKKNF